MSSILNDTKQKLGLDESYLVFDSQIIDYINSAFSTLNQLGVGPEIGYEIADAADTWDAFIGTDPKQNSVKTYVYLVARLSFDPPATSYLITAMENQKKELEWRLNVYKEETIYNDPDPEEPEDNSIIDGGES